MPKEMKAIPEGNLLRIAATKSVMTFSALKEKTGDPDYASSGIEHRRQE